MALPWPVEETPQLLAGVLMAVMGVAVLAIGFRGRSNRALSLYLLLAATREVLGGLDDPEHAPILTSWIFRVLPWFDIAIPFAAAFLAQRFYEQEIGRRARAAVGYVLLCAAVLAELAYLAVEPEGPGSYAGYVTHPAIIAYAGLPLLLACFGADLARRTRKAEPARQRGLVAAAVAFSLLGAFAPAIGARYFYGLAGLQPGYLALMLAALVPVTATIALLMRPRPRAALTLAAVLALGLGFAAWGLVGAPLSWVFAIVDGLLRLALPSVLLYTILRHRLFELDVKIRWTISRGAIAATFVAVFLVATELAQGLFTEQWGWTVGAVATGLLVFALAPLQRVAERLAIAAMPATGAATDALPRLPAAGRRDLYRAALHDAWADGALRRSERRVLEGLRQRLGVSLEEAARLEDEVVAGR